MLLSSLLLSFLCLVHTAPADNKKEKNISGKNKDKTAALQFLQDYNVKALEIENGVVLAGWNYEANLTDANKEAMLKMSQTRGNFAKEAWKNATSFAWKEFKDTNKTAYRMFKKLSILGIAALPEEKFKKLNTLIADMQDIYGKAKVCPYNATSDEPCNLSLEPELTEIFITSRNESELRHIWSHWRDASGKKMKDKFIKYVELYNEAAKLNGFDDVGEMWREGYESDDFEDNVEELWQKLKPFYEQLHAYVRQKLRKQYPSSNIKADGPIPAHLLGNMWGQAWSNIYDLVVPYPDKESNDVTKVMQEKEMTPLKMFETAEEFFTSLGLIEMTPEFWNRSIIEKPTDDREMVCHASAYDFFDGKDFRIKQCTKVNLVDFITIHHEMGHIEYYLQYAKQPALFRQGANPGFHEAVGDTIALSAATTDHLKKVGLLAGKGDDEEVEINTLMKTALDKIAFLPFGYLIDDWRWRVFDGCFDIKDLNQKWWEERLEYQGLCPPVKRTNDDLDAASKYHVAADVPYIRYFVSYVIQFQFHKALCEEAGHKGPLHKCDIYKNKAAGNLLSQVLSIGASEHWETAMKIMTKGKTHKMDAKPLIEYFTPLIKWLKKQNKNETIGWKSKDPMICP